MFADRPRAGRVLLTVLAALLTTGAAGWFFVSVAQQSLTATVSPPGPRADDLLLLVVAGVGALLTGWLGCGLAAAALAGLPGRLGRAAGAVADRVAPGVVRRAAALLLGTALASATAVPAFAAVHPGPAQARPGVVILSVSTDISGVNADSAVSAVSAASAARLSTGSGGGVPVAPDPDRLPLPAQPTPAAAVPTPAAPAPTQAGRTPYPSTGPSSGLPGAGAPLRAAQTSQTTQTSLTAQSAAPQWVTVAAGDCLWHLAARRLGPTATPAQIDAEWRRWYAANRDRVGPDPDLVLPGQRLLVPASPAGADR